jgi:hypothetical protein
MLGINKAQRMSNISGSLPSISQNDSKVSISCSRHCFLPLSGRTALRKSGGGPGISRSAGLLSARERLTNDGIEKRDPGGRSLIPGFGERPACDRSLPYRTSMGRDRPDRAGWGVMLWAMPS